VSRVDTGKSAKRSRVVHSSSSGDSASGDSASGSVSGSQASVVSGDIDSEEEAAKFYERPRRRGVWGVSGEQLRKPISSLEREKAPACISGCLVVRDVIDYLHSRFTLCDRLVQCLSDLNAVAPVHGFSEFVRETVAATGQDLAKVTTYLSKNNIHVTPPKRM
jgi:hypothetical protein